MYYRYEPYQNEAFADNVAWGLKFSFKYVSSVTKINEHLQLHLR